MEFRTKNSWTRVRVEERFEHSGWNAREFFKNVLLVLAIFLMVLLATTLISWGFWKITAPSEDQLTAIFFVRLIVVGFLGVIGLLVGAIPFLHQIRRMERAMMKKSVGSAVLASFFGMFLGVAVLASRFAWISNGEEGILRGILTMLLCSILVLATMWLSIVALGWIFSKLIVPSQLRH